MRVDRRSDLLAVGITDSDIQLRRRKGVVVSVRAGRYAVAEAVATLSPIARHRLQARTAAADLPSDAALSHATAACLHGIVLWGVEPRTVQVIRPGSGGGHRRPSLHTRFARLDEDEVVDVGGVRVTGVARTLVDLGRVLPFESVVVSTDDALHRKLVTVDELARALTRSAGAPQAGRARQAIAFADARTESVGESRSRVAMHLAGLPTPDVQVEVRSGATGALVARSDFGWEDRKTVGEFDGMVKYGRLLKPGQQPGDVVFKEKTREDRIRDEGFRVVRWTWHELDSGVAIARIQRALGLG